MADAGPDQTAFVGTTRAARRRRLARRGRRRADASGGPSPRPAGSAAALVNEATATPTFVVDAPGTYVAQLIVNDGTVDSAPDTVTISTLNTAPVANAGADQTVTVGATVTLDGSGSSDADGDALAFAGRYCRGPPGSAALLSRSHRWHAHILSTCQAISCSS